MVAGIGDVGVVVLIEHNGFGCMQHRLGRRLAISVVPVAAHTGECRDQSGLAIDLAYAIAALIYNIHIPGMIDGDSDDVIETRLKRGPTIIQVHGEVESVRANRHK